MQLRPLPFAAGPIFALIFWCAWASWILPEVIAWRVKRSTDSSEARDQGSLNLIAILWWTGIAMDFSLSLLLPQTAISWKRTALFFVGICLMLLGIGLRWYAVAVLGKYFTFDVAIQSGQILVEVGPYRYIRHPSYTGALLTLFGFGLALGNWAGLAAALSCMGLRLCLSDTRRGGRARFGARGDLQAIYETDVASRAVRVLEWRRWCPPSTD